MLIFNYSQHYIFTSARVSSHPPDLTVIPHLWNSSCIIYKIKKRNVVTLSWNNNSAMKYGLSRNDSVLWNLKFNSNIHFQTTSHRDLFVIHHLWWCTYVQAMYTGQPPSGEKTSKHCPIDVPFFFSPFGSCQRSTSNSMRWNQALLSMSHWCITRPGRSRLCKHTLSKPIEDAGCWPHQ